jgi:hypothetical protein
MNPEIISPTQPVPSEVAGTAPSEARTSLLGRALLALAALFVVVRALPILSFPLGRDQGTYLTIGQGLLEGKQLYRDLWDNKPPGIFYLYAGIAKLLGRAMWSAAVVDILLLLLISYFLFRFTEPYLGRAGAAIAVMVHASWHGEMKYFWIAQPETFQVVCVLAGYLLMKRRGRWWKATSFAAGFVLGYACWLKYNGVAFLPFLLFLPFLDTSGLDKEPPTPGIPYHPLAELGDEGRIFDGGTRCCNWHCPGLDRVQGRLACHEGDPIQSPAALRGHGHPAQSTLLALGLCPNKLLFGRVDFMGHSGGTSGGVDAPRFEAVRPGLPCCLLGLYRYGDAGSFA